MEAGYDKIPSPETWGNEISLFYPDDKEAVYGHVARNVNLIKTFSEMMQPYSVVKSHSFSEEVLRLCFEIRGCEFLDSVDLLGVNYDMEKVQNSRFNFWTINITIINPDQRMD